MGAEQAVQALPQAQRQVGVGTERPVADQHVARAQPLVQGGSLRQVVRVQRLGAGLQQIAALGVKQGHQVGDGEAAAVGLPGRLAEMGPQRVGVRHGKAGSVQQKDAVAVPAGLGAAVAVAAQAVADGPLQAVQQRQGQAAAGLAVGGGGGGAGAEAGQGGGGGGGGQNLLAGEGGGGD